VIPISPLQRCRLARAGRGNFTARLHCPLAWWARRRGCADHPILPRYGTSAAQIQRDAHAHGVPYTGAGSSQNLCHRIYPGNPVRRGAPISACPMTVRHCPTCRWRKGAGHAPAALIFESESIRLPEHLGNGVPLRRYDLPVKAAARQRVDGRKPAHTAVERRTFTR